MATSNGNHDVGYVHVQNKAIVSSAPPPIHSLALVAVLTTLFLQRLPSMQEIDRDAAPAVFTRILFPGIFSLRMLAWIRMIYASVVFGTSASMILGEGWLQETAYLPSSKLKRVKNHIVGIKTMAPFTSIAWNLLGTAFLLSGYVALKVSQSPSTVVFPLWLLRITLIMWEIAAPLTILVAAVIRYAIWPRLLAENGTTVSLKTTRNILMHNVNVLFATTEVALLGGVPVKWRHLSLAPLVGCAYIVWSWNVTKIWNAPEHGPQFIYFFFDTTLGSKTSYALIGLLIVMMTSYATMVAATSVLQWADGSLYSHIGFVVVVCGAVMRFRD